MATTEFDAITAPSPMLIWRAVERHHERPAIALGEQPGALGAHAGHAAEFAFELPRHHPGV
ncbi:hypothetical protein AAHB37_08370 [Glutamicibacter halophytocola]|uniref:hypothetical protein n=1 Tax=Glutamicibacter halophytocola TaxID=1933880 RepID=UPI00321BA8CF